MAIANLHAESWRRTYRGVLRDDYLDGPVVADRRTLWKSRLAVSADPERQFISVVERNGLVAGFVCVFLDSDPEWGALLDNVHVEAKFTGQGYGSRLMACAAAWVISQRPISRLHLCVYERNVVARRLYESLGGEIVNHHAEPAPDGTRVDAVRYGWRTLSSLAGAAAVADG